jgi:hypothetical protein
MTLKNKVVTSRMMTPRVWISLVKNRMRKKHLMRMSTIMTFLIKKRRTMRTMIGKRALWVQTLVAEYS